jgi:ubiquinone/menaquinone biosynthesis C-methylase UbiE
LVELAEIISGQQVLDVATGIGEPAMTAAKKVGANGRVLATDISPQMLSIAEKRAFDSLDKLQSHYLLVFRYTYYHLCRHKMVHEVGNSTDA